MLPNYIILSLCGTVSGNWQKERWRRKEQKKFSIGNRRRNDRDGNVKFNWRRLGSSSKLLSVYSRAKSFSASVLNEAVRFRLRLLSDMHPNGMVIRFPVWALMLGKATGFPKFDIGGRNKNIRPFTRKSDRDSDTKSYV